MIKILKFNKSNYLECKNYLENSYKQNFKKNQGIDEILSVIYKFSDGNSWIDLGSGGNSFLWNIPMHTKDMYFCDQYNEVKYVIDELKGEKFNQGCFEYAFNNYSRKTVDELYNQEYTFIVRDLLNNQIFFEKKFDFITQFGLLGLCKNKNEFIIKSNEIINIMNQQGIYIGANWLYSAKRIKEQGHNNLYLNEKLIKYVAETNKINVKYLKLINIQNDEQFDSVILYVLKK